MYSRFVPGFYFYLFSPFRYLLSLTLSANFKGDSYDEHSLNISIIYMSEAKSIAGTVGWWIGAFLVLLVWSLLSAYISRSITSSKRVTELDSLCIIKKDLERLHAIEQATLEVLLRLEKLAQDNRQLRNRHRP